MISIFQRTLRSIKRDLPFELVAQLCKSRTRPKEPVAKHYKSRRSLMNIYTDQDIMKNSSTKSVKVKEESKFSRMKQMLTNTLTKKSQDQAPANFEEAKNICKARKRKERQESIGSISQERKVIRSNSEERSNNVMHDGKKDIRRVVSHEDFQKAVNIIDEHKEIGSTNSPCKSLADILDYEDSDHERRRHQERFALPLIQRGRKAKRTRKFSKKSFTKKCTINNEFTIITSQETEHEEIPQSKQFEKDVPSSQSSDLSALLQESNLTEPVPSVTLFSEMTDDEGVVTMGLLTSERLLLSPRNSIIAQHRIFLDPNVQQTKSSLTKDSKNPLEKKLKQLSKQINSLKKKLKGYDEEFQISYGYTPSQADKMNDKTMRKCITEINKLKKDYKQLKSEANSTEKPNHENGKTQTLQQTIKEIEMNLKEKRIAGERTDIIEEMTDEQIVEEKLAVQQSLLYLESIHGRPTTKEDRDVLRPLYDRYRVLKRLMVKISSSVSAISDLVTIIEDEALDIITSPPQISEAESEKLTLSGSSESEVESSLSESLHTLTLEELIKQQKETNEEKKNLRHTLKRFENEFQTKTGRKLQKDDKAFMANVYISYKQVKAKSRLLDALVTKQLQS